MSIAFLLLAVIGNNFRQKVALTSHFISLFKVSSPCVETYCIIFCIKNTINTEMWA